MTRWRIGCSGFHYKHWKGSFYPQSLAQSKWFHHYCEHFDTLELNVTFYRFPRVAQLQTWHAQSPGEFKFVVKAPKAITHYKKLLNAGHFIADFYQAVASGLREKIGCLLFQFPSNFHYSDEHLQRILNSLDSGLPNVVEFRHDSWWRETVYKTLADKNISFSGISHPSLPTSIVSDTPLLYHRMHGTDELYASSYTEAELSAIVKAINGMEKIEQAYLIFNNDIHTHAVYNALQAKNLAQL